ncbi:MAG: hypothetical protein J3K34DRAFT_403234 [Monoraphidium minutum]|nr:MAG: hypothetical protein J3K34DRAFT_403234 [Monoraphidium minutum]
MQCSHRIWAGRANVRQAAMARHARVLPVQRRRLAPCRSAPDAEPRGEPREIGCSDLYNMVQAVSEQQAATQRPAEAAPSSQPQQPDAPSEPSAAAAAAAQQQASASAGAPPVVGGARYYGGLLTSDLGQDNGASAGDMLKRSLQLAGGVAGLLALLVLGFLASNGLL